MGQLFYSNEASPVFSRFSLFQNILNFAFTVSLFIARVFYKTASNSSFVLKQNLHGPVKHLGTFYSASATASVKEASVPSSRQALSS